MKCIAVLFIPVLLLSIVLGACAPAAAQPTQDGAVGRVPGVPLPGRLSRQPAHGPECDRRQRQAEEAGPDDPARIAVAVHLRQDVPEDVADGEDDYGGGNDKPKDIDELDGDNVGDYQTGDEDASYDGQPEGMGLGSQFFFAPRTDFVAIMRSRLNLETKR